MAASLDNAPSAGRLSHPDFVHTEENCFAHAALRRIFEVPFEPNRFAGCPLVYIAGAAGTGKTCLLTYFLDVHAEEVQFLRQVRLTAAEFAAELAEASVAQTFPEFRQVFAELDLFILEDIQSLRGRTETQQQLLFIINEVLAGGGRVVLTGRSMPGQLEDFNRKLVNRCHGGICATIPLPDALGRHRLLELFARQAGLELAPETLERMADQLVCSPRELQGAVQQMQTTARLQGRRVDADYIAGFLAEDVTAPALTLSQIARTVARHYGVSVKELRSTGRQAALTLPRQCAMALARELTEESLSGIGGYFSGRNHTTVLHSCQRVANLLEEHPTLRLDLQEIRRRLGELYG